MDDFMERGLKARPVSTAWPRQPMVGRSMPKAKRWPTTASSPLDFAAGRVMTFDNQWNDITASTLSRGPPASRKSGTFNVQVLGDGRVYVAWTENALEIDEPTEEIPGLSRIAAYDRNGNLLQDYTASSKLNNPGAWPSRPTRFGALAGALLVANFGDGTIVAYDPTTGADLGYEGRTRPAPRHRRHLGPGLRQRRGAGRCQRAVLRPVRTRSATASSAASTSPAPCPSRRAGR